jgi:hypothetical protein
MREARTHIRARPGKAVVFKGFFYLTGLIFSDIVDIRRLLLWSRKAEQRRFRGRVHVEQLALMLRYVARAG